MDEEKEEGRKKRRRRTEEDYLLKLFGTHSAKYHKHQKNIFIPSSIFYFPRSAAIYCSYILAFVQQSTGMHINICIIYI